MDTEEDRSPPAPTAASGWIGGAPASEFLLANQREQLVGVWVDIPEPKVVAHVPVAVSIAIDTSGSMSGEKIADARRAALAVVDGLADGDMIALVRFDSEARTLVDLTPLDHRTRKRVRATIAELDARGDTALFDGVSQAETRLLHTPDTHLVRRVVVISDGQATVGPTDPEQLGRLAELGMTRDIQVTALGVGLDYDESTLDAFAVRSSGRFYHLEESAELASIVADEMKLLVTSSAAVAEVEIVPASGVTVMGVDAARTVRTGTALRVPLGAMFAGQRRELLVRVRLDERADDHRALASLRLHFRDPSNDGVARVHERVVEASLTDDTELVAAHENDRTQSIIALREAAVLTGNASHRANEGDLAVADAELERAEQTLRERAHRSKDHVEKQKMVKSAERVSRTRAKMKAASSAPAAQRKSAGRSAALEANDANMAFDGF
ncbi:MAG TPA: VWA domain-containing protein [Nannocystaceae bacterium]|nr:VWA domain-containing protein [Nannocystaceae bacterium]